MPMFFLFVLLLKRPHVHKSEAQVGFILHAIYPLGFLAAPGRSPEATSDETHYRALCKLSSWFATSH